MQRGAWSNLAAPLPCTPDLQAPGTEAAVRVFESEPALEGFIESAEYETTAAGKVASPPALLIRLVVLAKAVA